MKEPVRECPREGQVLSGVLAGSVTADLGRHVAGCRECRDIVAVSTWLQGVDRETVVASLPRADRVWWRAQVERRLEERQALVDRAARPIRWFERVAVVALALTVGGVLWWHGIPTAEAALPRLSDPATFAGFTAALLAAAGLTARKAARRL